MKPHGYSTVSPYLVSSGAEAVIRFIEDVFDGELLRRYDNPNGSIHHAEVKIDDTVIMIGEANEGFPAFSSLLHIYVDDVDEVFQRALDAGATSFQPPQKKKGDPDRRGTVGGPAGNLWAIATMVDEP